MLCAVFWGYFEKAISLLTPLYWSSNDIEVSLYLAFSIELFSCFNECSNELKKLKHKLLILCVEDHFDEIGKNGGLASSFLGSMYTDGDGCNVDYDKAVHYFQKAHNAGLDCADTLQRFKKKLFGGYKFIGW